MHLKRCFTWELKEKLVPLNFIPYTLPRLLFIDNGQCFFQDKITLWLASLLCWNEAPGVQEVGMELWTYTLTHTDCVTGRHPRHRAISSDASVCWTPGPPGLSKWIQELYNLVLAKLILTQSTISLKIPLLNNCELKIMLIEHAQENIYVKIWRAPSLLLMVCVRHTEE